jgi:hypothetical protein
LLLVQRPDEVTKGDCCAVGRTPGYNTLPSLVLSPEVIVMDARELSRARRASNRLTRQIVVAFSATCLAFATVASCASTGDSGNSGGSSGGASGGASNGGDATASSSGNNSGGNGSGGNGSGGNGSGGNGSSGNGSGGNGSGGNGSTGGSGGNGSGGNSSTGGSGGNGSGGNSSTGGSGGNSSGGTSSSSGGNGSGGSSSSGASSSSSGGADGGGIVCSGTDKTVLVPNSTGWLDTTCNSWGIQGSWYCYADGIGINHGGDPTSGPDCKITGTVPWSSVAPGPGMCVSGTTGTTTAAWGAGLGLVMSQAGHDAGKMPFNASAKNIVGFAITLAGDTGQSDLRAYFNTASLDTTEYPYVGLPGLNAGNSPVTYNVLFKDAVVSDAPTMAASVPNPANIYDVQVRIKGGGGNNYKFCITSIKPIIAEPAPAGSCSAATNYGPPFCNQTPDYIEGMGALALQNDWFGNGGTDCVQAMTGGATCAGFSATFSGLNGGNTTQAFPSLVYGWQAGSFYGGYRAAKTLSSITSANSTWTYSAPGGGNYDVAWDIWLGPSATATSTNGMVELMVWNAWNGVMPASSGAAKTATVAGATWNVFSQPNMSSGGATWKYLAYQATASKGSGTATYDLNKFFQDAITQGVGLTSGSYLLSIQAGAELYTGSGTFSTSSYTVTVQ